MNISAKFIRFAALLLLVVMTLSMVSCDLINGIINGKHEHSFTEGKCECGESDPDYKPETPADGVINATIAELTEKFDKEATFRVSATVKEVVNGTTGAMIIEDETGSITVNALFSADEIPYGELESKPDEADEIVITCHLQKKSGKVSIAVAFIESYEAKEPEIDTITVAEAIEIGQANSAETERIYYIRATVTKVSNPAYGEMYIADETGEILVYNTKNADGTVNYENMTDRPVKGDEVLLYCTLNNYNGTPQVKSAWVIEFKHTEVEYDPTQYPETTIAAARDAAEGTKMKISGVVAQITYANGYKPQGVILVDGTSSIYVYDMDLAGQVSVGNRIEVAGEKAYWILESEASNAAKFGYKGSCQLDSAILLSNDKGTNDFDKSWITETTVKEIMDTPVSEDITNKIFKVTALVKKAPGTGFTNYYIDDIDGITGSYVYTQCNGGDFAWLDEFDGKFCTVYVVAQNAKSSGSGCIWRFLPILVLDEGYTFDVNKAAEYAVVYHGLTQFQAKYTGDPATELANVVSSELLGFEGATLSYTSSNEAAVYFTNEGGVVTLHCGEAGTATVTVTGSYNGKSYSETLEITVAENAAVEYITVADAIATPYDTDVTVKGIVGPSLVNQQGFYLFGEDGSMIAVKVNSTDAFNGLAIGHEIIITGMRERYIEDDTYTTYGQDAIVNAEIVANYYGNHAYSTEKAVTSKTPSDIAALNITESHSTELYIMTVTIKVVDAQYYSNIYISDGTTDLLLYCSSSSQYSWLKAYAGQTVTVEVAPCNWNAKTSYRGCVLAVVNEDGTKVYNELNFN